MEICHCCEEPKEELHPCPCCDELTCEDCFAPQSPYSVDPVTDCTSCAFSKHEAACAEAMREEEAEEKRQASLKKRRLAAYQRYHSPGQVAKRAEARAERLKKKREMSEAAFKALANILNSIDR